MNITKLKVDEIEYNFGSKDIVSKTEPENQEVGDLWFVSHNKGIKWEKTSRGVYSFIESSNEENKWISNNKGIQSSIANAVWQINVPSDIEGYILKYKVSSETTYDKFTLTLDGNKIVNNISGNGSEQSYSTTLTAGLHTLDAKYSKDSVDQDSVYDDCAYVILEPIYMSVYEEIVDYVGTKTTDEDIENNYELKPIGCDANRVFLSNGSTLDYFVKNLNTFLPDFGDIVIALPVQADTLTYNGSEQSPTWLNYNSEYADISGVTSATNAGTYNATFTPKTGYQWSDGTREPKNASWIINKANPSLTASDATNINIYKGDSKTISIYTNSDGELRVTVANSNVASCTLNESLKTITIEGIKNGYARITLTVRESINYMSRTLFFDVNVATNPEKVLTIPSQSGTLTYSGSSQTPVWNSNYDSTKMDISGDTSGTNAGTYTVTFTPKEGYEWEDGTTTTGKEVSWVIDKANGIMTLNPTFPITVYKGESMNVTITRSGNGELSVTNTFTDIVECNIEGTTMTITGLKNGDASIVVQCEESSNYKMIGKGGSVTVTERPKETISLPNQSGFLVYNGSSRTPAWNGYDSTKMTIGGTTSAINAGSYNASFTPKDGYQWSDGTVTEKLVAWTIDKATGSMTLSTSDLTITDKSSKTITVTRPGDGIITATSSHNGLATVSVSGTTVTVTPVSNGTNIAITISCGAGTNYTAPSSQVVFVTIKMIDSILENNTPATIKQVAQSGQAANYWSVGDKIPITLNGKVGIKTFSNETYYAYIIGFNHNSSREGNNTIHFKFGKNQNNVDICFTDSNLWYKSSSGFIMNSTDTNQGGWESSYMRQSICQDFLSAMPVAWRTNVISHCTKYSNNSGGGSLFSGSCTSTQDMIWILSEYEMYGSNRTGSYVIESEYQAQYDYYKNGNSKISYQYNNTSSQVNCWLRSPLYNFDNAFVQSGTQSTSNTQANVASSISSGFSPCFIV